MKLNFLIFNYKVQTQIYKKKQGQTHSKYQFSIQNIEYNKKSGKKQENMKNYSNIDNFLKQIKGSNYYCQPINFDLKTHHLQQFTINISPNKQQYFTAKIPQIKFFLTTQIIQKISLDLKKSKLSKNGLISAYRNNKFKHKMQNIHYLNQNDDQDIGVWQQAQDAFCVGFIVQKQSNYQNFNKRLLTQLKKCLQKKFQQVVFAKNNKQHDSLSELNPIEKIIYKHFRFFLLFEPIQNNHLLVNKIMYFPDAKFVVKPVKFQPSKFTMNKVYQEVISFKNKYDFGYLSLNSSRTKQVRLLLIDKFDPQLSQNPPPIIGIWLSAQRFQSKQEFKNYAWAVILQYLRNPHLKNKLSINIQRTGIICTIQKPQKVNGYIFEIPDQSKWNFKYQSQNNFKMPEEFTFTDQQIIFQQDKQQSDIQSIQNRSLMKNGNNPFLNGYIPENDNFQMNHASGAGGSGVSQLGDLSKNSIQNKSVKSNDQKDQQIKFLKKELQFYKTRCQNLQKMLNNPATLQMQAMQMFNPLTNPHLAFNNPLMYQSFQNNNLINPAMNMYQNLPNQQNNLFSSQNQALRISNASSNYNKMLNQSQIYEQQIQTPPQPVQIRKQLGFNKKKTFEEQKFSNKNDELGNMNLKKNESCPPSKYQNKQDQQQFQEQQTKQQNSKKNYFEYDYKNISFSQQNSFENELNSTHKFPSFESNQSQIFPKSPDFKKDIINQKNYNNFDKNKQNAIRNINYHEFSFDRKDDDFASSKNSKRSTNKFQFQIDQTYNNHQKQDFQQNFKDSNLNQNIKKIQKKYKNQQKNNVKQKNQGKNRQQLFQQETSLKNEIKNENKSKPITNLASQNNLNKLKKLDEVDQNEKQSDKKNINKDNQTKETKNTLTKGSLDPNQRRINQSQQKKYVKVFKSQKSPIFIQQSLNKKLENNQNRKQQENSSQNTKKLTKNPEQNKKTQQTKINSQTKKRNQQLRKFEQNSHNQTKKLTSISRIRQKVLHSDSQSDEQIKNIALRYKR